MGGGVGDEDEEAEGVVDDGTVEDGAAEEEEGRKEEEERRTTVETTVGTVERLFERVEDVRDSEEDCAATTAVNRRRGASLMMGEKDNLDLQKKLVLVYLNCLKRTAAAPTSRRIRFIREPAVSGIDSSSSTTVTTVPRRPNRPTRPATCMYASTDRPVTLGPSGMPSEKTCVASGISSPRAIARVVTKSTGSSFSFSSATGF